MDKPETAEFLCGLEGTDVTLDPPSDPPLSLPRQTWVIDKKLSERSSWMMQQEVTDGFGVPYVAAKFLCHHKGNPSKKAFMRIYLQTPVIGTQYQSPQIRRKQASKPRPRRELKTLEALKKLECDVVPDLLACGDGKQGEDSIVPGGFITYVVWDKVPGEPLSAEEFWELDLASRQAIRDKFVKPFRFPRAGRIDTNEEWHDKYYVLFDLAKPSPKTDWAKDTTGWTW
ncbi:hypothetical protein N7486_004484 [Penicillium sp. IBT 16267x]|nr:hypothetical protein N7486_004484 [Penicillium sp. IBT 16267x]